MRRTPHAFGARIRAELGPNTYDWSNPSGCTAEQVANRMAYGGDPTIAAPWVPYLFSRFVSPCDALGVLETESNSASPAAIVVGSEKDRLAIVYYRREMRTREKAEREFIRDVRAALGTTEPFNFDAARQVAASPISKTCFVNRLTEFHKTAPPDGVALAFDVYDGAGNVVGTHHETELVRIAFTTLRDRVEQLLDVYDPATRAEFFQTTAPLRYANTVASFDALFACWGVKGAHAYLAVHLETFAAWERLPAFQRCRIEANAPKPFPRDGRPPNADQDNLLLRIAIDHLLATWRERGRMTAAAIDATAVVHVERERVDIKCERHTSANKKHLAPGTVRNYRLRGNRLLIDRAPSPITGARMAEIIRRPASASQAERAAIRKLRGLTERAPTTPPDRT